MGNEQLAARTETKINAIQKGGGECLFKGVVFLLPHGVQTVANDSHRRRANLTDG